MYTDGHNVNPVIIVIILFCSQILEFIIYMQMTNNMIFVCIISNRLQR